MVLMEVKPQCVVYNMSEIICQLLAHWCWFLIFCSQTDRQKPRGIQI